MRNSVLLFYRIHEKNYLFFWSDVAFESHRHVVRDTVNGVLISTFLFPNKLAVDIADYIRSREENDSTAQRTQRAGINLIRDENIH